MIPAPPFLPRITRATVAGFDKIARAYRSVTRKQPHIRRRTGVFEQCVLILLLSSQFSPLRLLLLQRRRSARAPSAAMGKEKTVALERAKKATAKAKGKKSSRGGSSSRSGLPRGWIQGDWIRSTISQDDLDDLAEEGLIPHGSARLPEDETEPRPREGECVLLATHVDRGFSLPPHPFFRAFLNFFGAQLHHFSPNTIIYLAAFVSLCENFLGCRPHWGLFKHIFTCRSQSVKKANPSDERTQVIQMCGGLGIQMRGKSSFPAIILPESVRGWQSTWFYCKDQPTPGQSTGLPPFSMARVEKPSALKVTPGEKAEVKVLVERVVYLIREGVTGMDLLEVFLRRRIQPLQARDHPMWMYSGIEDSTRVHPEEVDEDTVEKWLRSITGNKDNPRGARRIPPLDQSYEPDKVRF